MRTRQFGLVLGWAVCLSLCGCGDPAPAPEPARELFDGTVTFAIPDGADPGYLTKKTVTFLAVDKPGRTRLIDAWEAPEGVEHARHNFPQGTTPKAMAGYYKGLMHIAGWKLNVDYSVADGSIHVYGVLSLDAGSDNAELVVTISSQR